MMMMMIKIDDDMLCMTNINENINNYNNQSIQDLHIQLSDNEQ